MWLAGSDDRGFTLIEMIVVVVLMGLLAALTAPAIGNSLSNLNLTASARHLAAVLRRTRSKAIADKQSYQITIAPETESYIYPDEGENKLITLSEGVEIKEFRRAGNIFLQEASLYFYPKGNSNGGEVVLGNERERTFCIKVEAISGRVKLSRGEEGED